MYISTHCDINDRISLNCFVWLSVQMVKDQIVKLCTSVYLNKVLAEESQENDNKILNLVFER